MPFDRPTLAASVPLDTNLPHIARVYDYWLGGKDNFAADRELAEKFMLADPSVTAGVRSNRAFLGRAVHYLVAEAGVRQFLDIGTGIPTANNTHEVAQRANPSARVVVVNNDPIVLTHARALLASHPASVTGYVDADLRDSGAILAAAGQDPGLRPAHRGDADRHAALHPGRGLSRVRSWPSLMRAVGPGVARAVPSGRGHPRAGDGRRGRDDEPGHGRVDHLPRPGAGGGVLRWPGAGRAGPGLHPSVAPRDGRLPAAAAGLGGGGPQGAGRRPGGLAQEPVGPGSGWPSKYWREDLGEQRPGDTRFRFTARPRSARRNSVIDERSFCASRPPKICSALRPATSVRTRRLGRARPSTGWRR